MRTMLTGTACIRICPAVFAKCFNDSFIFTVNASCIIIVNGFYSGFNYFCVIFLDTKRLDYNWFTYICKIIQAFHPLLDHNLTVFWQEIKFSVLLRFYPHYWYFSLFLLRFYLQFLKTVVFYSKYVYEISLIFFM